MRGRSVRVSCEFSHQARGVRLGRGRAAWHDGSVEAGERMLLWCDGGPAIGRAAHYPPPLEVAVDGGIYVLVDDGPPEHWHYEFVADQAS